MFHREIAIGARDGGGYSCIACLSCYKYIVDNASSQRERIVPQDRSPMATRLFVLSRRWRKNIFLPCVYHCSPSHVNFNIPPQLPPSSGCPILQQSLRYFKLSFSDYLALSEPQSLANMRSSPSPTFVNLRLRFQISKFQVLKSDIQLSLHSLLNANRS